MYWAGEVSLHRACCERATQPYSLGRRVGGGVYDISRLKTGRCYHTYSENDSRVFTHSLDVNKMYYYFMVFACICTIVFTLSQFHADVYHVYVFSLSNCINVFVWHNSSIRKHEYEYITTITIQFGESFQFKLSSSELLVLHTSIVRVFWCPRQTQHLRSQTSFRPEDHTYWERVPPSYDLLLIFQAIFTETVVVSYIVIGLGQRFTHIDSWDGIF